MKPKFTDEHKYRHGYRDANSTDIRKTFARVLRERAAIKAEAQAKVKPINATTTGNDRTNAVSGDAPGVGGTTRRKANVA